ncbi:MAG: Omp28-related outer membrane protein [Bacteroidetes bacterium]|nr:Omp28-related outer membrane protein [Bacteroidota bacterium]
MKNKIIIVFAAAAFLFACKERYTGIDLTPPVVGEELTVEGNPNFEADSATSYTKVMLLEDFTGEHCLNCPDGHAKIAAFKVAYPNRIVSVGIHSSATVFGLIAKPMDVSIQDLRTQDGTDVGEMFHVPGQMPLGIFNRKAFGGDTLVITDRNKWAAYLVREIDKKSIVKIDSTEVKYDASLGTISGKIKVHYAAAIADSEYISIMVIENGIIGPQESITGWNLSYHHEHILRKYVYAHKGIKMLGNYTKGTTFSIKFNSTMDAKWKPENCKIVVFTHKQKGTDYYVTQVREFGVK